MTSPLETTVLFVLDQTSKLSKQFAQREFDLLGIGVTVEQWVLLKVVAEKNILSQNELAKETHRDPASITRTLDILEKKGFLKREPIADNRRQYNINLSKAGKDFVWHNMPFINALRNTSVKGFTKAEIKTLLSLLHRIQKNME
jgi:MarR family transcriptional regulator, transcriptional regulator for hemolysin